MQNVEVDFLVTDVVLKTDTVYARLVVPEDRWVIGWGPWLGVDKGNVFEGHLALSHVAAADGTVTGLFMRGPHKESDSVMYDVAGSCDFFPTGTGRFVKTGDQLLLTLHCTDTGSTGPQVFGVQGSIRIFSVKAEAVV